MLKNFFIILLTSIPFFVNAQHENQAIKTKQEVIAEVKGDIQEITANRLSKKIMLNENFTLIDVRSERERISGYIDGSMWMQRGFLDFKIQDSIKNPEAEIIVYCKSGARSLLAAKSLKNLGYKNVLTLQGGINSWAENGHPLRNDFGEFKVININN